MRARAHGPEHQQENDGSPWSATEADAQASRDLPHVLRAAVTGRTDVVEAGRVWVSCSGSSVTVVWAPCSSVSRRTRFRLAPPSTMSSPGAEVNLWTPAPVRTWKPGSAPTSPMCAYTPEPRHTRQRPRSARAPTQSETTSSSSATRTTPRRRRAYHAGPRTHPCHPAAAGTGRGHGDSRRHTGERPVRPLRAGGGDHRGSGDGRTLPRQRRTPRPTPTGRKLPPASVQRLADDPAIPDTADTPVQREAEEQENDEEAPAAG